MADIDGVNGINGGSSETSWSMGVDNLSGIFTFESSTMVANTQFPPGAYKFKY